MYSLLDIFLSTTGSCAHFSISTNEFANLIRFEHLFLLDVNRI